MRRKSPQAVPETTAPADTIHAISENIDLARETLIRSVERLERLAAHYRGIAASIDEAN